MLLSLWTLLPNTEYHNSGSLSLNKFLCHVNVQMEQRIWALDLRLHYSDNVAMFQLSRYVTAGHFNSKDHTFTITRPKSERRLHRRRIADVQKEVCRIVIKLL